MAHKLKVIAREEWSVDVEGIITISDEDYNKVKAGDFNELDGINILNWESDGNFEQCDQKVDYMLL